MQPSAPPRPARSKNGCSTCRRRKVRCDEQRPRCSHCERLNLECQWRPSHSTTQWKFIVGSMPQTEPAKPTPNASLPDAASCPPLTEATICSENGPLPQNTATTDQFFDYASLMWDTSSMLGFFSPGQSTELGICSAGTECAIGHTNQDCAVRRLTNHQDSATNVLNRPPPKMDVSMLHFVSHEQRRNRPHRQTGANPSDPNISESQLRPSQPLDDHNLTTYFVQSIVPPILAEVEFQKRWSSMRELIISMSNSSNMVKCAILAFSGLMYCRREALCLTLPDHHYHAALEELLACPEAESFMASNLRQHLLTTIFFLCYVDILEDRVENAHTHLRRAHTIFREGKRHGFRPFEMRILLWIRLLDARAVTAGGEGLFLSENSESLITHPSPGSSSDTGQSEKGLHETKELDVEDTLFQTLYQPGIIFFQKVQSFMGRISKIDPWNRSRGTVEDETEVMQIASQILNDLRDLYDQRPVLMDHAIKGSLTPPHVSASLAAAITRAFRTYMSNYYASKIHLHRVAFKHLPLSTESKEALSQIRQLTKRLVADSEEGDALPVSQLWPLLMLGTEEQDIPEREWIRAQIQQMEKMATNARVMGHVLQEVQARQDANKTRVDMRSVMHDVFDSCFAII